MKKPPTPRLLKPGFEADLQTGLLAPLLERVHVDPTLCLEIRADSINVYYRGGNLVQVAPATGGGYEATFDGNYIRDETGRLIDPALAGITPPAPAIRQPADLAAWLAALPMLKLAMDLFFGVKKQTWERVVQQDLVVANNSGGARFGSRDPRTWLERRSSPTDFFICDIEYARGRSRFDFVGVHWPGTSRRSAKGRRLVLGEVKFREGALDRKAGLAKHLRDVQGLLATPGARAGVEAEMVDLFNQKRRLGLLDCRRDLVSFSGERPLLLLVLVDINPRSKRLRRELGRLPACPEAEICVTGASPMGLALYGRGILPLKTALQGGTIV